MFPGRGSQHIGQYNARNREEHQLVHGGSKCHATRSPTTIYVQVHVRIVVSTFQQTSKPIAHRMDDDILLNANGFISAVK